MDAMQQTDAVSEGRRIYVGNLRYSVTPADIETVLRETGLGNFEKIHISVDSISLRNPGYCFVEFPTREAAEQALITLEGIAIYDRQLKVGPCHPKTSSSRKYDNGRPGSESSTAQRWGDWRAGARPASKSDEPDARTQQREQQQHEPENPESKRLYVGGLGPMLNQEQNDIELREIFAGFEM
jgi:RNA recognition motif-containing protein